VTAGEAVAARRELARLSHLGLAWTELAARASQVIRRVVAYERMCWHPIDPATLLMTGGVVENLPPDGFPVLARCEYETEDVNTWSSLATNPWPVGILSQATHGHEHTSRRYRELLAPRGIGRELRASLVTGGACWAALGLYRSPAAPDFTGPEAAFVASVSATLAQGMRRSVLIGDPSFYDIPGGPGVVIVDDADQVVAASEPAGPWLAGLQGPGGGPLPPVVLALAARARALSRCAEGPDLPARARARCQSGTWMVIHATRLSGPYTGHTAVIIEPARPAEMAPLVVHAYGLTPREQDVTRLMVQGLSAKQAAHQLKLSTYTLQDHLRSVYEKVGVSSRRELVARVFFDHYWPSIVGGSALGANGWFAPRAGALPGARGT